MTLIEIINTDKISGAYNFMVELPDRSHFIS